MIGQVEATVLIGLSTVGGAFTEPIVREMARKVERPVIFPLSNPTARSEATRGPDPLDGRAGPGRHRLALRAGDYEGRTIPIAQCNNVFIFPAVGLGVVASGARRVTDGMMLAAARRWASTPRRGRTRPARSCPPSVTSGVAGRSPRRSAWRHSGPGSPADEPRGTARSGRGRQWTPEYPQPALGG